MQRSLGKLLAGACICGCLAAGVALGAVEGPASVQPASGAIAGESFLGPAIRMVLSLGAVLAVIAGLAWVAQRLRSGGHLKTGLIEIVSGISLGAREKVVLLRVGQEQVLVGVSPAGMRALHVIKDPTATPSFAALMENKP